MNGGCRNCKRWQDCKAPPDWFNYAEIRFCPYQCLWIIARAEILKNGQWPPQEGQAESPRGKGQFKTEASFVKPELIIGEVGARLNRTPNKGELLITQIEDGRTFGNLSDGARAILMYIKGKDRKRISFRRWQREIWESPKLAKNTSFAKLDRNSKA